MSTKNAFSIMMNAPQKSDRKTKSGYAILKGSSKMEEDICYLLQFDGLSEPNPGESSGGAILYSPSRKPVFERGEYIDTATNNQAEYTGLLVGLQSAIEYGVKNILIEGDSQLVVFQLEGRWQIKNEALRKLNTEIRDLFSNFDFIAIRHIYREFNTESDRITNEVIKEKECFIKEYHLN